MSSLLKTYGTVMTGLFVALTAIWVVAFIALPQLTVIKRAFIYVDTGGELAQVGNDIDKIYSELSVIDIDSNEIRNAGSVSSALPGPSSSMPMGPMSMGTGVSKLSPAERVRKLKKLQTKKIALIGRVKKLEDKEQSLKDAKVGEPHYSLKNFTSMSRLHLKIFLWTLFYAFSVTVLAFFACYPVAFAVSQASTPERRALMMMGLIIPYIPRLIEKAKRSCQTD